MAWNYDKSYERVQKTHDDLRVEDIELEKLTKTMDLDNLSTKKCRLIYGAHIYANISNFDILLSDSTLKKDDFARLIRCLHVYQKEVTRIVETVLEGVKIHFQGSKLHALFYKPFDNPEEIAIKSVLCALVIEYLVRYPFSDLFGNYKDFKTSSGIDIGESIGTKNGTGGDRELLFLGDCANQAAKIDTGLANTISVTNTVKKELPDNITELLSGSLNKLDMEDILEQYGIEWDYDKAFERMKYDKDSIKLSDIDASGVSSRIDLNKLSIRNNKKLDAVTFYADISGFTRLIKKEQNNNTIKELIRIFHVIRKEMREVLVTDFGGTRIQYQGDSIQGILYLPQNESDKLIKDAVIAAFGLQSSFESVLCDFIDDRNIHVAIGLDYGPILLSSLGRNGNRDVICIGKSVTKAASFEHKSKSKETTISQKIYDSLPEDLQSLFSREKSYYLAKNKTHEDVDALNESKGLKEKSLYISPSSAGFSVKSSKKSEREREVRNVNPWCK